MNQAWNAPCLFTLVCLALLLGWWSGLRWDGPVRHRVTIVILTLAFIWTSYEVTQWILGAGS